MSEENAHIEDTGDNTEGIRTELENEKDTSIVVEGNNNNFDENNELETTDIDDTVDGNITTDNDNTVVEEIVDTTTKSGYNTRGNERDYRKHIGRINDGNDYTFLGLGCKDYTFLQDNIKEKVKYDKDTTWSEDIYKHVVMAQVQPKEENNNRFK